MSYLVHTIVVSPFQENTHILYDSEVKQAIIIDPGDESEKIIDYCYNNGLKPSAIVNTHAHVDHIGAVADLKDYYKIPFYLHEAESNILSQTNDYGKLFGIPSVRVPKVDKWINREEKIKIGAITIEIIHTPGHTPGSICIAFEEYCFTGDTLFQRSVGRTDLPGGSWNDLEGSLLKLIKNVSHTAKLFCGHGPVTNLNIELIENPFLSAINNRPSDQCD